MSSDKPLTDGELSELRRRAKHCFTHYEGCDCRQLAHLEEVARLRAENAEQATIINELTPALLALKDENAALREIVQAVADMDLLSSEARAASGVPSGMRHADLIARARATGRGERMTDEQQRMQGMLAAMMSVLDEVGPYGDVTPEVVKEAQRRAQQWLAEHPKEVSAEQPQEGATG